MNMAASALASTRESPILTEVDWPSAKSGLTMTSMARPADGADLGASMPNHDHDLTQLRGECHCGRPVDERLTVDLVELFWKPTAEAPGKPGR